MENPIKMDDLGVLLFLETPIWCFWNGQKCEGFCLWVTTISSIIHPNVHHCQWFLVPLRYIPVWIYPQCFVVKSQGSWYYQPNILITNYQSNQCTIKGRSPQNYHCIKFYIPPKMDPWICPLLTFLMSWESKGTPPMPPPPRKCLICRRGVALGRVHLPSLKLT